MINPENPRSNKEGYPDPTAYEAIKRADGEPVPEYSAEYERFRRTLDLIYNICKLCGFKIKEHIVLEDKETGRIWR